jgi:hypothetical protein
LFIVFSVRQKIILSMKPFTKIASVIFAIVALGHLLRLVGHSQIMIDSFEVPMWISIFGFIVPVILCIGIWRESRATKAKDPGSTQNLT